MLITHYNVKRSSFTIKTHTKYILFLSLTTLSSKINYLLMNHKLFILSKLKRLKIKVFIIQLCVIFS